MDVKFINDEEKKWVEHLRKIGQEHLLVNLTKHSEQERLAFVEQVKRLEETYPGGLGMYCQRGRKLLEDSKNNVNPYEGFEPHIPNGLNVDFRNLKEMAHLEEVGLQEIRDTAFVLVAGGLGERLGYTDSKVSIPIEISTRTTFMKYYVEYILAFQKKTGAQEIPLAIMVSDDTEKLVLKLLKENNYFGMPEKQITIMKQEKVPALIDNDARFAQVPNSLLIETKPHGHGDIHSLLYLTGLLQKWHDQGKKWLVFFQDTNPLPFRAFPAVLGVSKTKNLEMNSVTVPRKPGEAVGAICSLKKKTGESLTVNVEYNQIEALFKACNAKEPVDEKGYSKYPGNINCLVFAVPEYYKTLQETKGNINEFINPKYADSSKTKFKSATRLECMMQDYPKLLKSGERVGITQLDRTFCFSTVKNDLVSAAQKSQQNLAPESASSCEYDVYWINAEILKLCGVEVEDPCPSNLQKYAGISLNFGARIVLKPSFGVTLAEIKSKFKGKNRITAKSLLVLDGDITVENLDLDGSLWLTKSVSGLRVPCKNYVDFANIDPNDPYYDGGLRIRGYTGIGYEKVIKF